MKKIVQIAALALVIVMVASSVGCGEPKRPKGVEDDLYEYGKSVIEMLDGYLDGNITAQDVAEEWTNRIPLEASLMDEHSKGTLEHQVNWDVVHYVIEATYQVESKSKDEVLEGRNAIAKMIGVKPRK